MKVGMIVAAALALVMAGAAYFFYSSGARAKMELKRSHDAQTDLAYKVVDLEAQKAAVSAELESKLAEASKQKEEEIARLKETYDQLAAGMKEEIEQGQVKITQLADRLSVSMVEKILFPSGQADITPKGLKVLERVGAVLKNTKGKVIRVEGHTDNVPITGELTKTYPTNWELSTARATNVVRFLQEKAGIEPARLQAVGMSEFRPVASNQTPAGRAQNRRIEIALMPEAGGK
jgi:chemotaxis protein MotB